jgi:hypothetical protein
VVYAHRCIKGGGGVLQMSEKLNRAGRILGSYGRQGGLVSPHKTVNMESLDHRQRECHDVLRTSRLF